MKDLISTRQVKADHGRLARSTLARLALVVFGVGLAILLAEIGVRVAYVHLPFPVQVKTSGARLWGLGGPPLGKLLNNAQDFYWICRGDERLYARYLPGLSDLPIRTGPDNVWHITTASLGFDDIGFRTTDFGGPWDGLVVGDSFSFCVGVEMEECWVQQLAENTETNWANLGITNTGSVSHLRYLEDYGWALKPKMVLWQFYPNDPFDDYNHIVLAKQGCPRRSQTIAAPRSKKPLQGLRDWLSHTFVSYNLVLAPALRATFPQLAGPQPAPLQYEQVITTNNKRLLVDSPYKGEHNTVLLTGIDLTKEAILLAAHQALERNVSFLLILIPRNLQVYADFLPSDRLVASAQIDDAIMGDIVAFAEDHQIRYVDLRPALREAAARGDDLYSAYDTHWDPNANRLTAQLLTEMVLEMLPPSGTSEVSR